MIFPKTTIKLYEKMVSLMDRNDRFASIDIQYI